MAPVQIPGLNLDPISSLRPHPVDFALGTEEFTVPAMPAVEWLTLLLDSKFSLYDIVPGLLDPEDHGRFAEAAHSVDDDLEVLALEVLRTASGREWWVTLRLLAVAKSHWHVLGAEMMRLNLDTSTMSLSAWLDIFTLQFVARLKPENATMVTLQLEMVPEGFEAQRDTMEISEAQFLSMGDD